MTKTVRIYGVDVEFTDQAPSEDGVYWVRDAGFNRTVEVQMGYTADRQLPHETGWLWSAPLIPSASAIKAHKILIQITETWFYCNYCMPGEEVELLMDQAIDALGGKP